MRLIERHQVGDEARGTISLQVPARVVFLTDGAERNIKVGTQEIILKRTTPRNMAAAGRVTGLVIQALRHLGQGHVDDEIVRKLNARLSDDDRRSLMKDKGLRISGLTQAEQLCEMVELPGHPWFVGCQFHPEFTSSPRASHPLFKAFVEAALTRQADRSKTAIAA